MSTAERIRLPDDCTIGYIVEALLGVPLVRCGLFHSHLENLQQVPASELHEQVRVQGPRGSPSRCARQGRGAPRCGRWARQGLTPEESVRESREGADRREGEGGEGAAEGPRL